MDDYDTMMVERAQAEGMVVVRMAGGRVSAGVLRHWQVQGGRGARRALVELPDGFRVNVRQSCVMLPESADPA